jgi:hypothetical protein
MSRHFSESFSRRETITTRNGEEGTLRGNYGDVRAKQRQVRPILVVSGLVPARHRNEARNEERSMGYGVSAGDGEQHFPARTYNLSSHPHTLHCTNWFDLTSAQHSPYQSVSPPGLGLECVKTKGLARCQIPRYGKLLLCGALGWNGLYCSQF